MSGKGLWYRPIKLLHPYGKELIWCLNWDLVSFVCNYKLCGNLIQGILGRGNKPEVFSRRALQSSYFSSDPMIKLNTPFHDIFLLTRVHFCTPSISFTRLFLIWIFFWGTAENWASKVTYFEWLWSYFSLLTARVFYWFYRTFSNGPRKSFWAL